MHCSSTINFVAYMFPLDKHSRVQLPSITVPITMNPSQGDLRTPKSSKSWKAQQRGL